MSLPPALSQLLARPDMYLQPVEYDVVAAFLDGYNLATEGGLLVGFREWLVLRAQHGNNLAWPALALRLAFPTAECARDELRGDAKNWAAHFLLRLFAEYWAERHNPNGLHHIFIRYHAWLQQQPWYGPSCPDYVGDEKG